MFSVEIVQQQQNKLIIILLIIKIKHERVNNFVLKKTLKITQLFKALIKFNRSDRFLFFKRKISIVLYINLREKKKRRENERARNCHFKSVCSFVRFFKFFENLFLLKY